MSRSWPVVLRWTLASTVQGITALAFAQAPINGWQPPDLPEAVASFGAVTHDGAIYVYGGHVGRVHDYSVDSISSSFRRLRLGVGNHWEELTGGPGLQGAALVSSGSALIRIGGMFATNGSGTSPILHSSREVARHHPADDRWEEWPALPEGRSSHESVVLNDVVYVVGGWELQGQDAPPVWADTIFAFDLNTSKTWREIPAPFARRALAIGTAQDHLYALGGLTPEDGPQSRVDVFDVVGGTWTRGPQLPGDGALLGFGARAVDVGGQVFVSLADGNLYRLNGEGSAWKHVGGLKHPRFMHRLLSFSGGLLAVGGADPRYGLLATVEVVQLLADDQWRKGRFWARAGYGTDLPVGTILGAPESFQSCVRSSGDGA